MVLPIFEYIYSSNIETLIPYTNIGCDMSVIYSSSGTSGRSKLVVNPKLCCARSNTLCTLQITNDLNVMRAIYKGEVSL